MILLKVILDKYIVVYSKEFFKEHQFHYLFLSIFLFLLSSCATSRVISEKDFIRQSTTKNLDNFGSLLWGIDSDSIIKFNKKNLRIIKKKGNENPIYIKSLNKYVSFLTEIDYNPKKISFEEKAYITAYLINFELKFQEKLNLNNVPDKSRKSLTFFKEKNLLLYLMIGENMEKYKETFETNNYFNLPLFKEKYLKSYSDIPAKTKRIPPTSSPVKSD